MGDGVSARAHPRLYPAHFGGFRAWMHRKLRRRTRWDGALGVARCRLRLHAQADRLDIVGYIDQDPFTTVRDSVDATRVRSMCSDGTDRERSREKRSERT